MCFRLLKKNKNRKLEFYETDILEESLRIYCHKLINNKKLFYNRKKTLIKEKKVKTFGKIRIEKIYILDADINNVNKIRIYYSFYDNDESFFNIREVKIY